MIDGWWRRLRAFWAADHGLSLLLALLVLRVFLLPALVGGQPGTLGSLATDLVLSLLLVAGASAVTEPSLARAAIRATTAVTMVGIWGERLAPGLVPPIWQVLLPLTTSSLLVALVLAQVFRAGTVTFRRVLGAVAAYLLLGLTWAAAYDLVLLRVPDSFRGLEGDPQRLLYFSFVTLTTVGYGDIVPVHPTARSLAMLEALVGQLYPAVLLARVVSLELQSRDRVEGDAR